MYIFIKHFALIDHIMQLIDLLHQSNRSRYSYHNSIAIASMVILLSMCQIGIVLLAAPEYESLPSRFGS